MQSNRIFDLETRLEGHEHFKSISDCRDFDLDSRKSMVIPMQHMMNLLEPYCINGAKILEVGCSTGLFSLRMASMFPEVEFFGTEQSDYLLQVLQENMMMANLLNFRGKFNYEWANLSKIPVEDHTADVVFSFSSLHRWQNFKETIRECNRICKKDGIIILYDLARDSEEGIISFILQYTGTKHEEFMTALKSSYTKQEVETHLSELGLSHWYVNAEFINLIITSKNIDASLAVADKVAYEDIFA